LLFELELLGELFSFSTLKLELLVEEDLFFFTFDELATGLLDLVAPRLDLIDAADEPFVWEEEVLDLVAGPFLGAFFLGLPRWTGGLKASEESDLSTGAAFLVVGLVCGPFLAGLLGGADGGGVDNSDPSSPGGSFGAGPFGTGPFVGANGGGSDTSESESSGVGAFGGARGLAAAFSFVARAFLTRWLAAVLLVFFLVLLDAFAVSAASISLNRRRML
jgi:hypothetical protein